MNRSCAERIAPATFSAHRLILARHGRTAANVAKALDSQPPGMPLDDVGRAQADALARRLADEPVTAVYASPTVRTQETAAPVAAAHGLPVVVLDGVREVSCGDLEGNADDASRAAFAEVYQAWLAGDLAAHLPGGDSALDLRARFLPAVEAVTAGARGAVVVITHGAAIPVAVAAMIGEDTPLARRVPNTGVVTLTGAPGAWAVTHWDPAEEDGDITADMLGNAAAPKL